ncbi:hypothetical protein HD554DRAFT_2015301 [Boletus coccyginus]|nr:hypothetical protein HD554DRAFT_2015301 [Boletus coccyginus]
MSAPDPLPQYSTLQGHVAPPTTYTVGRHRTHPLVEARHLRGHLALLHAFDILRRDVESGDVSRFPQDVRTMDVETRWGWFVSLAVERFRRWCVSVRDVRAGTIENTLPPIDVVMVWHAYLLNPIWYAEDTIRVPTLSSLPQYTEYLTDSPELLTNWPHPDQAQFWRDKTMTPYDPFDSARVLTDVTLQCPHCEFWTPVPILAPEGRGYAQSKFAAICSFCCGIITKESLGLFKFAKDVVMEESDGLVAFLAGTLHSRDEMSDTRRASLIKNRVRSRIKAFSGRSSMSGRPIPAKDVMDALDYSASKFSAKLKASLIARMYVRWCNHPFVRTNRILHAYSDDRPFSIELVGAVLRQGSFVRKMAELGWTHPGFLSDSDGAIILEHCVARYHAYLNLIAGSPGSFFVPTLDIDLAWHTHQLMADRYQKDCKGLVGRYVDHDDKVEENHLATAFDVTCRAWIDRYKVPYTYCGCPHPGTTLGQRVRRVLEGNQPPDTVLQPPATATPGTHPSDHNAVFPMHRHRSSMNARERRREKLERRHLREAREASQGTGDLDTRRRSRDHPEPFLYPIPLYYVPIAGCAIGVGGVVGGGAPFVGGQCAAVCGLFGVGGSCGFGSAGCGGSACGGGGGGGGGCGGGGGGGCGGGG